MTAQRIVFGLGVLALIAGPIQTAGGVEGSTGWQLWSIVQLLATTCLALTLVYGPGLVWLRSRARPASAIAVAILPGPLLLAALGLVCWLLGQWQDPAQVARLGIALVLGWLAWQGWRPSEALPQAASLWPVIGAAALVAGFAVAKANVSTGPAGELYAGTISRTLEVGGHSDSRISFHVVQLVANNFPPFAVRGGTPAWRWIADTTTLFGRDAPPYFAPWSFASRGPIAGLLASPIVMATGAAVPQAFPDQPWQPFDHQGFAAYRIALIVFASLTAWAVFGATAVVASAPWPLVAGVITLLSPFFVHELYFTWPKLAAAGFVLASFALACQRRALASGLVLGLAYLVHPLAILSAPVVGAWIFVTSSGGPASKGPGSGPAWASRVVNAALFGIGAVVFVAPWVLLGIVGTGDTASQGGFVSYFRMADGRADVAWPVWLWDRWQSFANTFVPFHLLAVDQTNRSINALNAMSDRWVRAGFLYWNTLPFALGLPGFVLTAAGVASAIRRAPGAAVLTVVAPALFLTAYWGDSNVGLMRFCGHVLFVSIVVLAVWGIAGRSRSPGPAGSGPLLSAFLHPVCFAWRAAEIALMAFGTTMLARRFRLGGAFQVNDAASLVIAAACLAGATVVLRRAAGDAGSRDAGNGRD